MDAQVLPIECTVFYSFLRVFCHLPHRPRRPLEIRLLRAGAEEDPDRHNVAITRLADDGGYSFTIEALIDRAEFPDSYAIKIVDRSDVLVVPLRDVTELETAMNARSMMGDFHELVNAWVAAHPGQRPRLLDIGGRARSGNRHADMFGHCDVTILDIVAGEDVDLVCDVHRMGAEIGQERFDFAICISVFEHLVMPWKAVLEINKVMRQDGVVLIATHQTTGMHDLPWDYYRFSDESWKGLFNAQTGFAIEKTMMGNFQRIVPQHYYGVFPGFENAGGFAESAVIARKTAGTSLSWPVEAMDLLQTSYPA
jgi:hypothetical protein